MGSRRARAYFVNASAPALATCASCSEVAPDTPTEPTILPVHQDRDPALERAGAAQSQQPEVGATLSDEVLEHLGGTPVEDGRVRLVLGRFDAASCVPSMRSSMTRWPPESRTAMSMFHLFF